MAKYPKSIKAKRKIHKVLKEFKNRKLRIKSKHGRKVKSRKQALAIALSEARRV